MKLLFTPSFIFVLRCSLCRRRHSLAEKQWADSLRQSSAENAKPASSRVKLLPAGSGEYSLNKPGEFKADLDSAPTYTGQARAMTINWAITGWKPKVSTAGLCQPGSKDLSLGHRF
jgi:hypothetical protein